MTFHELCRANDVTPAERDDLAWFLALYRARMTWEDLRSPPKSLRKAKLQAAIAAERIVPA